jgi:hypothetical protein
MGAAVGAQETVEKAKSRLFWMLILPVGLTVRSTQFCAFHCRAVVPQPGAE